MDDILGILKAAGIPAGYVAVGAGLLYVADKLHLWERPNRKSEREILSMEEQEFRLFLSVQVTELRAICLRQDVEIKKQANELMLCEKKHGRTLAWLTILEQEFRRRGLTDLPMIPADLMEDAVRAGEAIERAAATTKPRRSGTPS